VLLPGKQMRSFCQTIAKLCPQSIHDRILGEELHDCQYQEP